MKDPTFVRLAVSKIAGYVPGEQPKDLQYVKLNTNENPYPPSPRVLAALAAAVSENVRLYPDPVASDLRKVAGHLYGFSPDHIMVGNGSDDLLSILLRATTDPGDSVAYPVPTYSLYDTLVALQGAVTAAVPFPSDFRLPAERLGEKGQKLTIVCNPNAPSGTLTPVSVLAELAGRLRGLLVVDEAYIDFANGETALGLVHQFPNVVVLRTFSKSFSLAGMRIGLAFARPGVIAELGKVKDSYNLSRLSLVAATAALEDYAWMEANAARVKKTRARLTERLRALGLTVPDSATNFVLARRPGVTMEPVLTALKTRGVLVRYFNTPDLFDALRISVGTDEEIDALLAALPGALG